MVKRQAKKGPDVGQRFWRCAQWPTTKCSGISRMGLVYLGDILRKPISNLECLQGLTEHPPAMVKSKIIACRINWHRCGLFLQVKNRHGQHAGILVRLYARSHRKATLAEHLAIEYNQKIMVNTSVCEMNGDVNNSCAQGQIRSTGEKQ